ncbi:MAG: addA, partial [Bacillota bacterium]|nr:addA [Bacillota bacterium]
MEWTKEQKSIIDLRNKNILVSAAAGSGKTAVLVERIINLIKYENEDVNKFLIVTFTNAAASGMKQKIQKSLMKSIKNNDGNKEHLRRQLNLLNKSNISTIHSFCIDVVRKNFHIIGIDPNFRVGDPNEIDIMLKESIDEVLEVAYEQKSEDFINLVESFTKNRDDLQLTEIIKDVYHFILSFPDPLNWLYSSVELLSLSDNDLKSSPWMESVKENAQMLLDGAQEALMTANELCKEDDGPEPYLEAIALDIYDINEFKTLLDSDFEKFLNKIHNIKFPTLKQIRGKNKEAISEEKQNEVKGLREEYKKIIGSIKKQIPNKSLEDFSKDINYMHTAMSALYKLIDHLMVVFKAKKIENAIVDFSDVEHYALEILRNKEIGETYKNKFNYIFIDEYQDSNRLQETLIDQIKRNNNVFMVGDVKQSIYRFRLADPGIFNEKSSLYPNSETAEGLDRKIDLNKNFRSRKEILDSTNYIFNNIMSAKIGEVDYTKEVFLNCGASFDENRKSVELNIIDKNSDEDDDLDDEIKNMKTAELEALYAVQKIRELIKDKTYVQDKSELRNIDYKDIVILMRSVSNWADIFEEVFNDEGIPFYFDGGTGYFETIEIQIILNLLKIVDNIRQDIPLLSVMRSPIGKFTTEELIKIRVMSPKFNYIDAVYFYKNNIQDELSDKINYFIFKIEEWKKKSRFTHLNDFIWEVLMETGYYYFVGVLPKGNLRQANLRLLTDKAFEFEKTSMRGLYNFLRYVEKLNVTAGDMGTAKTLSENDNVVRLMTIHKSKGLEFPVVIICGSSKKFNKSDTTKNILKHRLYGIAPKYINADERIYKETFPRIAVKNVIKIENLSEEMRVLYVAMTRAVDKLIIIGTVSNLQSKAKKWQKGPTQYNIYMSDSFLDWICISLFNHKTYDDILKIFEMDECICASENLSSVWNINKISLTELSLKEEKINEAKKYHEEIKLFKNNINSDYADEINRRLKFEYSYKNSVDVPTKLSVTDLKVLKDDKFDNVNYKIPILRDIPMFKEKELLFSKAEIGTIVHFVMQHLNINESLHEENIKSQISDMVVKKLLTDKEASVVDVEKIKHFFMTDIGSRMKNASVVKREVPFVIKKPAKEIISTLSKEDVILMQGIIDCYFYEDNEAVIIDYKTDDVLQVGKETIENKYKPQILSYKEAVEKLTGKKVKACYLYLFETGEFIEIF